MPRGLLLTILALVLSGSWQEARSVLLEVRVFNGVEEVTRHSRLTVHPAGDRNKALVETAPGTAPIELTVTEGIYDAQAIHERDGKVVDIQWAHRLVVMKYPDEGGRHLEVLNFKSGFGALQVRAPDGSPPDVALYASGERTRAAAQPVHGPGYVLFIVPAGTYDISVTRGSRASRHAGIEIPRDRTRLWIVPVETQLTGSYPPAAQKPEQQHHQRDDEDDVNEAPDDIKGETQQPDDEQDDQ